MQPKLYSDTVVALRWDGEAFDELWVYFLWGKHQFILDTPPMNTTLSPLLALSTCILLLVSLVMYKSGGVSLAGTSSM
jgi:hypothetical protein